MWFTRRCDGVYRVQAQSIETVAAEPMQCVLDGEGAHFRLCVVDGAAPRRMRVRKELWRNTTKIVSFRPEMIVDGVEENHDAAMMRGVDQGFQILGPAIT